MTHTTPEVEEIVEEFDNKFYYDHEERGLTYLRNDVVGWLRTTLTQDRAALHTSLVAAVEGKKKQIWSEVDEVDYNQALDDTLTIINSIFKE